MTHDRPSVVTFYVTVRWRDWFKFQNYLAVTRRLESVTGRLEWVVFSVRKSQICIRGDRSIYDQIHADWDGRTRRTIVSAPYIWPRRPDQAWLRPPADPTHEQI